MITKLVPWVKFAGILLLGVSLFVCYTLYQKNQDLRDAVKVLKSNLAVANANVELQKKLTEEALATTAKETHTIQEVTKYVNKVDKVLVKENPTLAEDANKLWKEALLDE